MKTRLLTAGGTLLRSSQVGVEFKLQTMQVLSRQQDKIWCSHYSECEMNRNDNEASSRDDKMPGNIRQGGTTTLHGMQMQQTQQPMQPREQ